MPTENYQVHNIYQYKRKTYKNNRNENSIDCYMNSRLTENDDLADSPRSDRVTIDEAGCSCDIDTDGEIANILHKKCPVIALAQQQLQRILDDTDKILCDNTDCCRSVYDLFCLCKQALINKKCGCILVTLIVIGFFIGLIIGSATCGTTLRKFNSPFLTCIENLFISGPLTPKEALKAIVADQVSCALCEKLNTPKNSIRQAINKKQWIQIIVLLACLGNMLVLLFTKRADFNNYI